MCLFEIAQMLEYGPVFTLSFF